MTSPLRPWESNSLQNSTQFIRNANSGPILPQMAGRSAPVLPPRPSNSMLTSSYNSYNSYMPYSGLGGTSGYGGYNSYGSYGMPYRNSIYNSYGSGYGGGFNSYGMSGGYPSAGYSGDDSESRFIQYAEESSRNTFASVESIVRAFNSMAMMLDNTFFAMTSSFRAVLSVAENFGRLRSMFGHIWYSVNVFRFFNWVYRKLRQRMGYKVSNSASMAWREAATGAAAAGAGATPAGSNWPTLAFLGVLVSAPYIISKFLPKYEDKSDPGNWKSPGIRAKAVFDFIATSPNELTIQTNDIITLAPTYMQEEMRLKNTGWAFAVFNGKSGNVPLNYLVISKSKPINVAQNEPTPVPRVFNNNNNNNNNSTGTKTHTKRVSFGENQIFENVDLDDYYLTPKNDVSSSSQEKNLSSVSKETTHSSDGPNSLKETEKSEENKSENSTV